MTTLSRIVPGRTLRIWHPARFEGDRNYRESRWNEALDAYISVEYRDGVERRRAVHRSEDSARAWCDAFDG